MSCGGAASIRRERSWLGLLALSLFAGAALPADGRAQAGSCAADAPVPAHLLSSGHEVPRGAGLVLDPGTASLEEVRLVGAGETPHRLTVEPVAERLVVLRIPATLAPGEYELRGVTLSHARPFDVTDAPLPTAPAAPRVSALRRREHHDTGSPEHADMYEIALEATLRGEVPDGVIALVGRWSDDEGEETSWGATSATPVVLASLRPCAGRGRVPDRGTRIRLRSLDRFGQLSPETAPRRVR